MAQSNPASVDHKSNKSTPPPPPLPLREQPSDGSTDQSTMSPAEAYITQRVFQLGQPQAPPSSLNQRINDWRDGEIRQVYQSSPHRYRYGTPSLKKNSRQ